MNIEEMIIKIQYANSVIEEFKKSGEDFDPFACLQGTGSKNQKYFEASVEFICAIEKEIEKYSEAQRKICFS